jgi:hypothetical protein
MYAYRKSFVFLHECMSASVGNTINHALPRLHDIEAISRDINATKHHCKNPNAMLFVFTNAEVIFPSPHLPEIVIGR